MKRQYLPKKKSPKSSFHLCPISSCNRKYKREQKLIQHVEKEHYYETRCKNSFSFSILDKIATLDSLSLYIPILYDCKDLSDENICSKVEGNVCDPFVESAIKLLPQSTDTDFSERLRICFAQRDFAKRICQPVFLKQLLLWENIERLIIDLQRFFNLGLPYYDTNFCPTLFIDLFWHAIMQNETFYREICRKSVGSVVPHCANQDDNQDVNQDDNQDDDNQDVNQDDNQDDDNQDDDNQDGNSTDELRYKYFLNVFQHRFGKLPFTNANATATANDNANDNANANDTVNVTTESFSVHAIIQTLEKFSKKYSDILKENKEKQRREEEREAKLRTERIQQIAEKEKKFQHWLSVNHFNPVDWNRVFYKDAFDRGLQGDIAKYYAEKEYEKFKSRNLASSC